MINEQLAFKRILENSAISKNDYFDEDLFNEVSKEYNRDVITVTQALEMLEILKKYLSVETEKYYSKSVCVLVNENIYFEEPKNETDDYKKIKEWLEND